MQKENKKYHGGGVEKTKNKIGFTLAELLAVIAILGVIAFIAFPAVNKVINNSKEKAYTAQKEIILSSAKNWGIDHINDLSETEDVYLSIEDLRLGGYLEKKQVINPITDEEMNGCVVIHYKEEFKQYGYEYNEVECKEVSNIPVIVLNGDKNMTISLGETYTELGATATYKEQDISSNIEITGMVDTNTPGTYMIRYNITYNGKKAKEVTRTVKVSKSDDPKVPVITLAVLNSPFNENGWAKEDFTIGVTIDDMSGAGIKEYQYCYGNDCIPEAHSSNITNPILISNESDSNYVCAIALDNNNHTSEKVCTGPYKLDKTAPTLTIPGNVTITPSQVAEYDLKAGVSATDSLSGVDGSITTSGELSVAEKTYTITYTVKDKAGNSTSKTRKIIVKYPTATDIIKNSPEINTNDPDKNPRYVGSNPKNYVKFNNELWRIIGVFNGQAKIIRNEPYSTGKVWNSTNSVNDWNNASLKTELNTTFLNSIDVTSKSYIDTTYTWKVGGAPNKTEEWTRSKMYYYERGTEVYSGRTATWTGAIGLMYPSDYGYATNSTDDICNTTSMNSWNGKKCYQGNWLTNTSHLQWTLTPISNLANHVFYIYLYGNIDYYLVSSTDDGYRASFPVLFLKSTIKITSGTGTNTDPYILSS